MTGRTNTCDKNGILISDANKQLSSILYNHLNLPTKVTFSDGNTVEWVYDAFGMKVIKKSGSVVKWYVGGLEYATKAGPDDPSTFSGFKRNIIVGPIIPPIITQDSLAKETIRRGQMGATIFDRNSNPQITISEKAIKKIIDQK